MTKDERVHNNEIEMLTDEDLDDVSGGERRIPGRENKGIDIIVWDFVG